MKVGKIASLVEKRLRRADRLAVEGEEADAEREEEGELKDDEDAAPDQGPLRVPESAAGEEPLDDELVGPVARHREEAAADDAGPERVGLGRVEREVEEMDRLPRRRVPGPCAGEPSRDSREENRKGHHRARQVDDDLDQVDPDDGLEPSQVRVEGRRRGESDDRDPDRNAGHQGDRDGRDGEADARRHHARHHEDERREAPRADAEAPLEERVRGRDLAPEVAREEKGRDRDPPDEIPERRAGGR